MNNEERPLGMMRGTIACVCLLSLIVIFIGAPLLGYQITGASLFFLGFGWTKLLFLVGVICSLITVMFRRRRPVSRAGEAVSLGLHILSFVYGGVVSTIAVVPSGYPFEVNQAGFIANVLSSLGYLCLGVLIWALAGFLARR